MREGQTISLQLQTFKNSAVKAFSESNLTGTKIKIYFLLYDQKPKNEDTKFQQMITRSSSSFCLINEKKFFLQMNYFAPI